MITNIQKIQELYDMHSHKAQKVDELLSKHLPYGYSSIVVSKANEKGITVSRETVRKVKSFFEVNLSILNILIEIAKDHKKQIEKETQQLDELLK